MPMMVGRRNAIAHEWGIRVPSLHRVDLRPLMEVFILSLAFFDFEVIWKISHCVPFHACLELTVTLC